MQLNLSVARDRVLGVFLGTSMMWLVFERLFPRSAADEMVRIFIKNLRLFSDLVSFTPRRDDKEPISKVRSMRDQIYRHFGEVNAQSDAVPFETGTMRAGDMAARDRIRRWQASLRSFYLLEAPLLQFRIFGSISSKSEFFTVFEDDFRFECSRVFLEIATSLENQLAKLPHAPAQIANLVHRLDAAPAGIGARISEREQALLRLTRNLAQLIDRMQAETVSEGLYDLPDTPLPRLAQPDSYA
jgi:multidrug resistance protein MdtO